MKLSKAPFGALDYIWKELHDLAEADGKSDEVGEDIDNNMDFATHLIHYSKLKPLTQKYLSEAAKKLKSEYGDDIEFDD